MHIDPDNLIEYEAKDGTKAKETEEGLLLHEMGHAKLINEGDPSHDAPGPDAEKAVRDSTNSIREEPPTSTPDVEVDNIACAISQLHISTGVAEGTHPPEGQLN